MYDFLNKTYVPNVHFIIDAGLSGLFSGAFGLIGSALSAGSQSKINSQNIDFQRETNAQNQRNFDRSFDYTVQQNLIQQEREDTAHQREVADLMAAGLSPLASTSGSTTGNMVAAPNAPNLVAPKADATGYIEASNSIAHLGDIARDIYSIESENSRAKARNELEWDITQSTNANKIESLKMQISSAEGIADNQLKQDMVKFVDQLEATNKIVNLQINSEYEKQSRRFNHEVMQSLRQEGITEFYSVPKKDLASARQLWCTKYNDFVNKELPRLLKSSSSSSVSGGGSAAGIVSANGSLSNSESKDDSMSFDALRRAWLKTNPYPVSR